jgi:hypothetical protein
MAKKVKKEEVVEKSVTTGVDELLVGMRCYQKVGGGSHRFPNRIIKKNQKFWATPETLPKSMKDLFKEVAPDKDAVIVRLSNAPNPVIKNVEEAQIVEEKFELVPALDENGVQILKGNSALYNVVDEFGKAMNEKPLRKGKAEELLAALNA